jgi:uncharacterized damage-inducible protein DinB
VSELERIADELRRAYDGDAWHGPSVRAALEGVDARMATTRHVASAHTICELVLHMTAWTREVARRLHLGVAQDPEPGDWPPGTAINDTEWKAIVAAFDAANADVLDAIAHLNAAVLDERIGDARDPALGSGVTRYVTLHGLAQHHAYHSGQISLLKKAMAPEPRTKN